MTDLQVSGRNITVSGAGDTVIWFNAFAEESAGLRAKLTESGIGGCTLVTVDVPDWDAALSPWQAEALSFDNIKIKLFIWKVLTTTVFLSII